MNFHGVGLAPIGHPQLDLFLLGYIAAVSVFIALFFVRFWRETRDTLFLAFAIFFAVQGGIQAFALSSSNPNVVGGWIYILQLLALVLVTIAILRKNIGTP